MNGHIAETCVSSTAMGSLERRPKTGGLPTVLRRLAMFGPRRSMYRSVIGGILIFAGVGKSLEPHAFLTAVDAYQLVSHAGAAVVASVLPSLEIVLGTLLVLAICEASAALLTAFLMSVFCVAVMSAHLRGLSISCGCFSNNSGAPISRWTLIASFILLGAALGVWWTAPTDAVQDSRPLSTG